MKNKLRADKFTEANINEAIFTLKARNKVRDGYFRNIKQILNNAMVTYSEQSDEAMDKIRHDLINGR